MNSEETLKQLLLEKTSIDNPHQNHTIYGIKDLNRYKDTLLELGMFKFCEELNFIDFPAINIDNKAYTAQTVKYSDGLKFGGKCYLLSISLTPEMYNPDTIHTIVKDGASITQTIYDYNTFEPKKKIILEFSPEHAQDDFNYSVDVLRKELHERLDKVIDNPEDYQIEGKRGIIIRGIFGVTSDSENVNTTDLSGVVSQEVNHFMVFYLKDGNFNEEKNRMDISLEKKFIPNELKEKFTEEFGEKINTLTITEEEIDNFLEKNKQ